MTSPTQHTGREKAEYEAAQARWAQVVSDTIQWRVQEIARLDRSTRRREITKRQIALGGEGMFTFFDLFMFTFDPRNQPPQAKDIPMVLWPKQRQFLRWLRQLELEGEDGVTDKSRDVGVTWLVAGYMVYRWLTEPGWTGAIGSRKGELLDRIGDPKTMFWKAEYVIRMLPFWLLPDGFDLRKHRHYTRIINPETGATLTGEAGPDMGRGGRSSFYFLDEFGTMPRAEKVMAAVGSNSQSILYASTATGPNTVFYDLVHDGNIPHFRIEWKDDPRKTQWWHQEYSRKYGPRITAQEVDINYSGGGDDVIIPIDWVKAAIDIDLEPKQTALRAGLDVSDQGQDETAFIIAEGPRVVSIESWQGKNPVESAGIVAEKCHRNGVLTLRFDNIGIGSGVQGALAARSDLEFDFLGVNVGQACTDNYYPDDPERPAKERFANLKAELWWALRLRFWNTWRLMQGEDIPHNDCISIPDDPRLRAQLSMPRLEVNERGLLRVESKAKLKQRGVASPDRADALILTFADMLSDNVVRVSSF